MDRKPAQNDRNHTRVLRLATNENAAQTLPQKRSLTGRPDPSDKRVRVPLGGKDQNRIIPLLQRSKSSINLSAKQQNAHPPQPLLGRQPNLGRSSSSLGFSHSPLTGPVAPPRVKVQSQHRHTNPHKNNIFPASGASRSVSLEPHNGTDSLNKSISAPIRPASQPLASTFSLATETLHALNVPHIERHDFRDPQKQGADLLHVNDLIDELSEDPHSIESMPAKVQPLANDFSEEFPFSAKDSILGPALPRSLAAAYDVSFCYSSDELVMENDDGSEPTGLTKEDLESLLEF